MVSVWLEYPERLGIRAKVFRHGWTYDLQGTEPIGSEGLEEP